MSVPLPEKRNKDVEVVEERRREYALSSLQNIIANEDARLEDEVKKEKEAKEKEEKEARGEVETAEEAAAAAEAEESKDDVKIPPPAEKLFELLYDEIEHKDITAIGVPKDDPLFTRGMELLRIHTAREIREAIDKTKQARDLKIDVSMLSGAANIPKDLHQFQDGDKMQKRCVFAKTQVRRYMAQSRGCASPEFSPEVVKELDTLIKEAKVLSKKIGNENRRAMGLIWNLLKPWWKHMTAGTLLKFVGEVSLGPSPCTMPCAVLPLSLLSP